MTLRTRIRDRLTDGDDRLPLGLTLLCAAIAATLVFPLTWLVIRAAAVDRQRAMDLVFSAGTAEVLVNSLVLMAGVTAASILIGVPLAYLTARTDLPFPRFWSVAAALPLVVPSYVGAFSFVSAFGPQGAFHNILAPLGVERVPNIYGLSGTIFVITLYTYPYVYLTTRAALLSFDTTMLEAARTLNHGRLAAFRRVTLPTIRPAIAAGALLSALYAVSDFGTPSIMRLPVFTRQIYVEYNSFGSDYAALLSLQLLVVVVLVLALEWAVRSDRNASGDDAGRTDDRVSLGRLRWPATLLPAAVSGTALLVPLWILGLWLLRAESGRRPSLAFEPIMVLNSVSVSAAAAVAAALAAIPIAYFAANHDSPFAVIFERATYVGFAVPGIVLALALVYFGSGYAPWIYQTLPLLIFAYVVRFLPQAVGSTRTSILQIDRRLVEAARTLGESSTGAFRRVTFPLTRSGIVAGAALVFLTTMKELPVTLVLRPTGFDTIVTQIWRAQQNAFYQYAVVPTLILLLISGLSMVVLLTQEGGEEGL
ncbi:MULTISPECIES: ABC transporter permease [Halorubrum]|uniref:Iron(III) transport system permease protein n=2 Tax=Halorubrum TaxID=56688 RepID=A0A1I6FT71_HALSD|nr:MULTISPECIES: iron ABC transporter permease [Halorubrum]TKX53603.1 iron ABC transporter permease [Halorubrum sp. SP3]TKX69492.1 iron ABC transporter permease [Halorubrum sp. SP9]SFR33104.1 iron(III) transport system permease protein [Halorubrum sodomense]